MDPITTGEKASRYFRDLREHHTRDLGAAVEQRDLGRWLHSAETLALHNDVRSVQWIFGMQGFENYTFADALASEGTDGSRERYQIKAERIAKLVEELSRLSNGDELPAREGHARILIKRQNDKDDAHGSHYEVIAAIPADRNVRSHLANVELSPGMPQLVFINPSAPCAQHALDQLYKNLRPESRAAIGVAGYIEVRSWHELMRELDSGGSLDVAFMDPTTRETRHAGNYTLAALTGYFSNIPTFKLPPQFFPDVPR